MSRRSSSHPSSKGKRQNIRVGKPPDIQLWLSRSFEIGMLMTSLLWAVETSASPRENTSQSLMRFAPVGLSEMVSELTGEPNSYEDSTREIASIKRGPIQFSEKNKRSFNQLRTKGFLTSALPERADQLTLNQSRAGGHPHNTGDDVIRSYNQNPMYVPPTVEIFRFKAN